MLNIRVKSLTGGGGGHLGNHREVRIPGVPATKYEKQDCEDGEVMTEYMLILQSIAFMYYVEK